MDDHCLPCSARCEEALARTLHDALFDPQPSFNLAESYGDDRQNSQPSLCSPHASNQNQQALFDLVDGTNSGTDFSFPESAVLRSASILEQPLYPIHILQDRSTSDTGFMTSTPEAALMRQDTHNDATASRKVDQTVAGERSKNKSEPSKTRSAEAPMEEVVDRARTSKSERARNAANQRHAKTRSMRTDSQDIKTVHADLGHDRVGDQKEKDREKNRLAAAKCRERKKGNTEDMAVKHRELSALNSSLKKQVQDLRGELTDLRTLALDHQECYCHIMRYNNNQGKRFALSGFVSSPPSMDSHGTGWSLPYMEPQSLVEGTSRDAYTEPMQARGAIERTP